MILFENALQIVLDSARETGIENVDIDRALNRVLAQDVISDIDMPPFNKSAMDGYACRREDILNELGVVETIPAGYVPRMSIHKNECAKIMTGAIVPPGADCVIKVEDTENISADTIRFTRKALSRNNICNRAEDIKKGDVVLRKGEILKPQHIAILSMVGCTNPLVACQPKVGIIATGNELIEPSEKAQESKIRNSNSYQLYAQVLAMGAIPFYYGIARDTEEAIDAKINKAIAESNVILISGGVSMGDFDLVPDILGKNGFKLLFEKVGIKPGKPTTFAISDRVCCFGLAGNPVSTFVLFEIMVKPFLFKMMGHNFAPGRVQMYLGKTIKRKRIQRESIIPVAFAGNEKVVPIEYHGSAHISSLSRADGLIFIPVGVHEIKEGKTVHVRQI